MSSSNGQNLRSKVKCPVEETSFVDWGFFEGAGEEFDLETAERDQIRKLLEKKKYDPEKADWEETMKVKAFLCRKGYSRDAVRSAMEGNYN